MQVSDAYKQAVESGLYEKPPGLRGKYDNVRRFWEDEVTCHFIKPHVQQLRKQRALLGKALRIFDLGCGSGDGYELLTRMQNRKCLEQVDAYVLPEEAIEEYLGIDINPELLRQGQQVFKNNEKVRFKREDFCAGLSLDNEPPYDIYLANYGTISHCTDTEFVNLLAVVAKHAANGSLFIGDWLGGYSYEWQNCWTSNLKENYTIDYVVSYIYEEQERQDKNLERFELRLMDKATALELVRRAAQKAGVYIKVLEIFDRSLFIGRHIETGEYNDNPQPLRTMVNSLLEQGQRTDLNQLVVDYQEHNDFEHLNKRFRQIASDWNKLVEFADDIISGNGRANRWKNILSAESFLGQAARTLNELVNSCVSLKLEDIRANIVEPQLAYLLRSLEANFQDGIGMGHGIGVVLQIKK